MGLRNQQWNIFFSSFRWFTHRSLDFLYEVNFFSSVESKRKDSFRRRRNTTIHPENQPDVQLIRQRSEDSHHTRTTNGNGRQDTCPICLADPSIYTVQTNCGHLFCGEFEHCCW